MAQLKKGDIIQILRKGYYICDKPYDAATQQPCVLFNIPDGATKEKPTSLKATDASISKASGNNASSLADTVKSGPEVDHLTERIVIQGDKVRDIKKDKSTPKVKFNAE